MDHAPLVSVHRLRARRRVMTRVVTRISMLRDQILTDLLKVRQSRAREYLFVNLGGIERRATRLNHTSGESPIHGEKRGNPWGPLETKGGAQKQKRALIFPRLCFAGDQDDHQLRPLQEAALGTQALLALQASLLLWKGMPEFRLEGAQENVQDLARGPGVGQSRNGSLGLAGGAQVGGTHAGAGGGSA